MVRWEAKYDALIGFCGPSENHKCSLGLEVIVGEKEEGYNKFLNTFEHYSKRLYARVVIVDLLHKSLPKLALCATTTCNKFIATWVRKHWAKLKKLWNLYCRAAVGPILGHANDGDAHCKKLMLEDYRGVNQFVPRFNVGWEGGSMVLVSCLMETCTVLVIKTKPIMERN